MSASWVGWIGFTRSAYCSVLVLVGFRISTERAADRYGTRGPDEPGIRPLTMIAIVDISVFLILGLLKFRVHGHFSFEKLYLIGWGT